MKFIRMIFTPLIILLSLSVYADEYVYLNEVTAKATAEEKQDMAKLSKQIAVIPTKEPYTGRSLMKVTRVDKGSVYEREGIKVGDLVAPGSPRKEKSDKISH